MIRIILEAIYDDYLQAKYANHEQRRDDLTTLESFARTFEDPVDFLSQLSLMATADTEGTRAHGQRNGKDYALHNSPGERSRMAARSS